MTITTPITTIEEFDQSQKLDPRESQPRYEPVFLSKELARLVWARVLKQAKESEFGGYAYKSKHGDHSITDCYGDGHTEPSDDTTHSFSEQKNGTVRYRNHMSYYS